MRRKFYSVIIAALSVMLVSGANSAQAFEEEVGPRKGAIEIGGMFSITQMESQGGGEEPEPDVTAHGTVGVFLGNKFKLGVSLLASGSGEFMTTFFALEGTLYPFKMGNKIFPYVTLLAGTQASVFTDYYGDTDTNTSSLFGLGVGVAHYLNPRVALKPEFSYHSVMPEEGDSVGQYRFQVGIAVLFGG